MSVWWWLLLLLGLATWAALILTVVFIVTEVGSW